MNSKFKLGQLVSTPGALDTFTKEELTSALERHQNADWGDMCKFDKKQNDIALKTEGRLLSSYEFKEEDGSIRKLWIITECDRSVTTFLLPDEY